MTPMQDTSDTATITNHEYAIAPKEMLKEAPRYQGKHAKGKNQKGCFGSSKHPLDWLGDRIKEMANEILDTGKVSNNLIARVDKRCGKGAGPALAKHLMGKRDTRPGTIRALDQMTRNLDGETRKALEEKTQPMEPPVLKSEHGETFEDFQDRAIRSTMPKAIRVGDILAVQAELTQPTP